MANIKSVKMTPDECLKSKLDMEHRALHERDDTSCLREELGVFISMVAGTITYDRDRDLLESFDLVEAGDAHGLYALASSMRKLGWDVYVAVVTQSHSGEDRWEDHSFYLGLKIERADGSGDPICVGLAPINGPAVLFKVG